MRIAAFRITHFRSIVDTGTINLSLDNVTALVGQNESGKTAVLEALAKAFSSNTFSSDDIRHGDPLPTLTMTTVHTEEENAGALAQVTNQALREALSELLASEARRKVVWKFSADKAGGTPEKLSITRAILSPDLKNELEEYVPSAPLRGMTTDGALSTAEAVAVEEASLAEQKSEEIAAAVDEFFDALNEVTPTLVLFNEDSGTLPNKIDITDDFRLKPGAGSVAAQNFLTIAGINLKQLVTSDTRTRSAILKRANSEVTREFLAFWRQTIGTTNTLELECDIHQHPVGHELAGKAFLEFLITDNATPLYPNQRSRGTRWFISFFLQLRAAELRAGNRVFLLDEPGANLHEKAQGDVLTLIEKIRPTIGVIYTTHSPHLIGDKYHRILAVERDSQAPASPSRVLSSHALGAASIDTLSPILTTMGVALSRQQAIKHKNNVLIEELSSHYYFKAFWKLLGTKQEAHFLAATGTSHVPTWAQLLLGWGLEFVVVVDDEQSGRKVYNSLKRDMFLDDDAWAKQRMYKLEDCHGIEDVFHVADYKLRVLHNKDVVIAGKNSEWAKKNGSAKAFHALMFLQSVEQGAVKLTDLHQTTQANIEKHVSRIVGMLANYKIAPD